ncbi:hypothetical protein KJ786_03910 [Patescibacteria group bacterium]|nr:hypothetical protein [Patescibacteria group bacterium]
MIDERKDIKSEGLEISKETGGEGFSLNKKEDLTSIDTKEDFHNKTDIDTSEENFGAAPTPVDISRKKYYDSERDKNKAKITLFNVLKYLIPIFVSIVIGLLALFGAIWAYKLNNIAEPIGGIKAEINNLKSNNNDIEADIEKLEDRINKFLEKNIK